MLQSSQFGLNSSKSNERIVWIDIFKGIAICLMVIGHVTGQFNQYIYQFHMAAFFFISGYTTKCGKRNIIKTIWDKLYSLIIPYISFFFIFILADFILDCFGLRTYLFEQEMVFIGVGNSIKQLFLYGNCYAWLLGAGWFVIILFAIEVVHSCLITICNKNIGIYGVIVFVIYEIGYYFIYKGYTFRISFISNDLVMIGLAFFGLGFIFGQKNLFSKILSNKIVCILLFIFNNIIMYYFGNIYPITVNYTTRKFNSPFLDMIISFNGIFLIYLISKFIEKIKFVNIIFIVLGQNTLGILFLHFLFFKIGYYILYLMDFVPLQFICKFLPTEEISVKWWWFIALVSICCCLILWKLLLRNKIGKFLLGADRAKWDNLYGKLKYALKSRILAEQKIISSTLISQLKIEFRKPYFVLFACIGLLICIPLINQGIMCNDELQYYFWSKQGFIAVYKYFHQLWIGQGRFLTSIFTPIWVWLSMISDEIFIYRLIPVLSMLLNVFLFFVFLYKLFKNKSFSIFCSLVLIAFLPITFAPMAPNAYTTSFCIPFSFLLTALLLFIKYIDNNSKKLLWLIVLFMFIAFSTYEIFVTYVPLFCIMVLYKKGIQDKKLLIKYCLPPILTGVIYIIAYVLCRVIMPSNYEGNQIGFTFIGAFHILLYLFKVSFPGYFLLSPTYQYLNSIYHTLQLTDYIRIGIVGIGVLILLYHLFYSAKQNSIKYGKLINCCIILVAVIYSILPALPLAISSMYQGNVGENTSFIALPVSYFTYFSAAFLCSFIVWKILQKCPKWLNLLLLFVMVNSVCLPLQYMNSNFSNVQNSNFTRLKDIENFITTDHVMSMNDIKIYSEDIFKSKLSLSVHDSYWQDNLNRLGSNIEVLHGKPEDLEDEYNYYLTYVDDDYFMLEGLSTITLAFKQYEEEHIIELFHEDLVKIKLENPIYEKGFYIYVIEKPIASTTKNIFKS